MKELKTFLGQTGSTCIGVSTATSAAISVDRETFKKEKNIVYKIKRLEVYPSFVAAGAGYNGVCQLQLLRKNESLDASAQRVYGINKGSELAVIYAKQFSFGDSYGIWAAPFIGESVGPIVVDFPDGFEPIVVRPIWMRNLMRIYIDTVGGRSWLVYSQWNLMYYQETVTESEYRKLLLTGY